MLFSRESTLAARADRLSIVISRGHGNCFINGMEMLEAEG
jgi:hypothetical protein